MPQALCNYIPLHCERHARTHARTHASTHTHARTHARAHARTHTHTHTHTHTNARARTRTRTRTRTRNIHTQTNKQTHTITCTLRIALSSTSQTPYYTGFTSDVCGNQKYPAAPTETPALPVHWPLGCAALFGTGVTRSLDGSLCRKAS